MLREFFDALITRCSPGARELGLAYEAAAINARHRRVGKQWQSHLAASRSAILQAAARCRKRDRVFIIGAGSCLDVPVAELAERFSIVILADVAVSPPARRWQRRFPGRVQALAWDASGALVALASRRKTATPAEIEKIFERSDPGQPPGGEPDLVVSANCLSQLGLVPAGRMVGSYGDDALPRRCASAAARRHLAWLAERAGVRVLITDTARLDLARDGRELAREGVFEGLALGSPAQTWRWMLSPIPEVSPDWHRVHEMGAWIDGPA